MLLVFEEVLLSARTGPYHHPILGTCMRPQHEFVQMPSLNPKS